MWQTEPHSSPPRASLPTGATVARALRLMVAMAILSCARAVVEIAPTKSTDAIAPRSLEATHGNGDDSNEKRPPCIPPPMKLPADLTDRPNKVIIAHRGASAHLPEHTLAGYRLAMELGADYIEPDLVATRDRQLIAIHSMDLNITTDVAEKFPDRKAYSQYLKREGYFAYNFDWSEIQTLRVRQRLPHARTTLFDGMFGVPSLTQILDLVRMWNAEIDPLLTNSTLKGRHAMKGVYAELKDYTWLTQETDIDLVQLLFDHIDDNTDLWESSILDRLCFTKKFHVGEYGLPPLVLQSFEASVLEQFTNKWKDHFQNDTYRRPVPPRTLLVDRHECLLESFWFNIGDKWASFLTGVGPEKSCLQEDWRTFMQPAIKRGLAVHPWTQRPELDFVESVSAEDPFESMLEETIRLFCRVGIHGVFTEAVSTTLLAAASCDEVFDEQDEKGKKNHKAPSGTDDGSSGAASSLCYESDNEANLYVGFASFVMGAFLSGLVAVWFAKRPPGRGRRQLRIPTVEVSDDQLEMM